jgi:transposase-like protein
MMTRSIPLSEIRIDGGTQPREEINHATVDEYAEAMRQHVQFPALIVYHDGSHTWLADGFHRYHAALKAEFQAIDVEWRVGTVERAKVFAASANAKHGLRRTAGDKRRAIEMVLSTAEGRRWSQERIAKHCGVAQSYVSGVVAKRADYHSDNPQKNPQPAAPTKAEQKRARIAGAAAANPKASNSSIARQLGVDRETVAAVRSTAETSAAASASDAGDPPSAPEPAGYSTPAAHAAADRVLEAARRERAAMTENDWKLVLAAITALRRSEGGRRARRRIHGLGIPHWS